MNVDHYERLSCGHQNNLLLVYPDKHKNKSGVCPKGCLNTTIVKVKKIDPVLSNTQVTAEP